MRLAHSNRRHATMMQLWAALVCLSVAAQGLVVPLHLATESHTIGPVLAADGSDASPFARAHGHFDEPAAFDHHDHDHEHEHEHEPGRDPDGHAPHPIEEHLNASSGAAIIRVAATGIAILLVDERGPSLPAPAFAGDSPRLAARAPAASPLWRRTSPRAPPAVG
jgi:hypothetical protein